MPEFIQFSSPIGAITACSSDSGISRIDIGNEAPADALVSSNELLQRCKRELEEYFSGQRKSFDLPIDWLFMPRFQVDVLRVTLTIPFGSVRTYGEIARELGKPAASRAVGKALAQNPLPILIPCHRVVAASGHLTGFSAADGIVSKAWLLQLEGHHVVAEKLA